MKKQVDTTIIIAFVGLLVGGIMLAIFLPMFKMGGIMHH
jgi:type II secretory pathway component PulF